MTTDQHPATGHDHPPVEPGSVADFDAHRRRRHLAPPPAAPPADHAGSAATTLVVAEDLIERFARSIDAISELITDYSILRPDIANATRLAGKLEGVNLCIEHLRDSIRTTPTEAGTEWTLGTPSAASTAATTPIAAYATIIAAAAFRYGNDEARRLIKVCDLRSGALIGGHGA